MTAVRCPVHTRGLDLGCHRLFAGKISGAVSGLSRLSVWIVFHVSWELRGLEIGAGRRRGRGRPEGFGKTSTSRGAHEVVPA
jgi:hypothetical protein